jgi:DNA-directed RNA polymerase specialized sigma24 family protein
MKYLNPMTDEEIAASLGVSEATAKRLYRDADRELLKRKGLPQKTSKFEDQNKLNN